MASRETIANPIRIPGRGIALRAGLLVGLLLCVVLGIAWRFWRSSPSSSESPNWSELDRALLSAIRDGDHAKVQALLDQAADVNAHDNAGETALMQAALNSDTEMMRLLLQRGADVHALRLDGVPVLLRAVHDPDKVRLLLRHGAKIDPRAVVLAAMVPGSRRTLELLLRQGGNPNADAGGFTALMAAAFCGDLESVTCLLEYGADLKIRTPAGYTALNAAAFSSNPGIVRLLLDRGADPNARYEVPNSNGDFLSPALTAALKGNVECLKPLLDHGADPNMQEGSFERTALLAAATTASEESVRLLLAKGANVNASDWEGDTPLDWARRRGETSIVQLLRRAGGQESSPAKQAKPRPLLLSTPLSLSAEWRGAVRAAVAASLPPLQRSGQKITETNGCITCHQHSLVAMTVGLARKHGFGVDEEIAAKARAQVVDLLGAKAPKILLGADLDPTHAPYTLVGLAAEDQKPNLLSDALVHYLVLRQRLDGRWLTEVYRPPEDASDFMFTALAVRGLQVYAPKGRSQEIAARIARARSWLLAAKPAETVDSVFQLLGLHWANAETESIRKAAEYLLRQQREDGGWAQLPTLPSDAYATGQVLFALHEAGGIPADAPAYRRGVEFLLKTQLADGSWFVPTRCFPVLEPSNSGFPHGRSQFISAAATCWATMALVLTAPPPQPEELADNNQNDFAPKRIMPRQAPITPVAIKPAREVASGMSPSELVLGVNVGAVARAYPINMLAGPSRQSLFSQEVVNDQLGGQAIAVTWCELCHNGAVYVREIEGRELTFGFAGQLWKENMILYDRETGTLWSQFVGEGKQGPLQGKKLRQLPVIKTDWQSWYAQYPTGTVALLNRNSENYRTETLLPAELALGIASDRSAKAWSFERLKKEPILNEEFDGQPVLVVFDSKSYTARLYARTLEDRMLTFRSRNGSIVDDQTGSGWELVTGRAIRGPLVGKSLAPLPATVCHQTSWIEFHPSSALVRP